MNKVRAEDTNKVREEEMNKVRAEEINKVRAEEMLMLEVKKGVLVARAEQLAPVRIQAVQQIFSVRSEGCTMVIKQIF